eukprot:12910057-Prorocentrum_lima.AAC.1
MLITGSRTPPDGSSGRAGFGSGRSGPTKGTRLESDLRSGACGGGGGTRGGGGSRGSGGAV